MSDKSSVDELKKCYYQSPYPSFKVSNYFEIYTELFAHLRGKSATFIETGVLNGGSLFMWRKWLGDDARIIGIDLNPSAKKWEEHGFEIYIGDQGDPSFWQEFFGLVGSFDALLDDGGHQSFQQIITLREALRASQRKCVIVIEDTCASFLKEFSGHHQHSFLEYSKDMTDVLLAKTSHFFPGQFPRIKNADAIKLFSSIYAIQFYSGIVAFKVDPVSQELPQLLWNRQPSKGENAQDFRYQGCSSATVDWPNMFEEKRVVIRGGIA